MTGHTQGLKASPLRRLERLLNRRIQPELAVSPEFARTITEISHEIQRQVAALVDRRGRVRCLVVGDARSIYLPDLTSYRQGRDRLCGLRLIHTHLASEPLTDDDLTDLALLRLDLVAAIEVLGDGLPGLVRMAHLLPNNDAGLPWELLPPSPVHQLAGDFLEGVQALEEEFARNRAPRPAGDTRVRAILVHVSNAPKTLAEESLEELAQLSGSAGVEVVHQVIQRRPADSRFVVGKGRLQQTVIKAMQLGAEMLVFDLDLSPAQVQAIATFTDLKILDRTQVILDIFAQHAETREGKIQVELAQLRYLLPRLAARQTAGAFSRLAGGIGGRGPGETKLEIDRRRAQDRLAQLEREVQKLGDRRRLRRGRRSRNQLPIVSIVGYTNAGKSSLLNQLTESNVPARDALFATLNPVSRRLRFPQEREVVVTDTVGFIRELPKDLMAAFRTTMEELEEADVLLHVLDASSHSLDDQHRTVCSLLAELGLNRKPTLLTLNKMDRCDPAVLKGVANRLGGIPICALDRQTFGPLLQALADLLWPKEAAIIQGG